MSLEKAIPAIQLPKLSNILVQALLFLCFSIAQLVGSILSELLADATCMFVDVLSYLCNIYVEWYKAKYGTSITKRSKFFLDIVIPLLSISALIATTVYITIDAAMVIRSPPTKDQVDVDYMYAFSVVIMFVDFSCWVLFSLKGKEAFFESEEEGEVTPPSSLDTSNSSATATDDKIDFTDVELTDVESQRHPREI